jgi:Zn-dependent protease/CBS domain-containing protein
VRQSIRLGRVAGIPIGLNGGALVVLALLAAGLAFGRLPAQVPGRSGVAYAVSGVVAAALFLASVLVHELGHALVARRHGVEVESITLWLLGGVAQLRGDPRSPKAEFNVAAVGPATSFALGVAFGLIALGLNAIGVDRLVVAVAAYLAVSNVVLAVFNLIPAAPLDGGRVLRAAVWRATGDPVRSAVVAARAGRIFGFVLIGLGLIQALLRADFSGLWWVLIGWFLVHAAAAEEQRATLGRALHGVRVSDVMTADPVTADPERTIAAFVNQVALTRPFSTYPLVGPTGRLTGLVTLNRIRRVPPDDRPVRRLVDIACPPEQVPVARPDEPLIEVLPRLGGCADGRLVVVDPAGRVVGIVSPRDISTQLTVSDLRTGSPYPLLGGDLSAGPHSRGEGVGQPAPRRP